MNQTIYTGYGSGSRLAEIVAAARAAVVFVVADPQSYTVSGAERLIEDALGGVRYVVFREFEPNPTLEAITRGLDAFRGGGCDFVIGIGGGTAMDIAKAVALLAAQQVEPELLVRGEAEVRSGEVRTVMVPTTAGTGSESTHFAVVYLDKRKYSLAHTSMLSDFAILEPALTASMPPYVAACTGMDALCQAIESFWSVNSSEESREYSRKAIALALPNLARAVTRPDEESREALLLAANLAGRAINIAKTTVAHAVSYPITSLFGVPHGHAVALTLPGFITLNAGATEENVQDVRGLGFARNTVDELLQMLGAASAEDAARDFRLLMKRIGLATRLVDVGIAEENIETIVANGLSPQRAKNNPVRVEPDDLRALLRGLL